MSKIRAVLIARLKETMDATSGNSSTELKQKSFYEDNEVLMRDNKRSVQNKKRAESMPAHKSERKIQVNQGITFNKRNELIKKGRNLRTVIKRVYFNKWYKFVLKCLLQQKQWGSQDNDNEKDIEKKRQENEKRKQALIKNYKDLLRIKRNIFFLKWKKFAEIIQSEKYNSQGVDNALTQKARNKLKQNQNSKQSAQKNSYSNIQIQCGGGRIYTIETQTEAKILKMATNLGCIEISPKSIETPKKESKAKNQSSQEINQLKEISTDSDEIELFVDSAHSSPSHIPAIVRKTRSPSNTPTKDIPLSPAQKRSVSTPQKRTIRRIFATPEEEQKILQRSPISQNADSDNEDEGLFTPKSKKSKSKDGKKFKPKEEINSEEESDENAIEYEKTKKKQKGKDKKSKKSNESADEDSNDETEEDEKPRKKNKNKKETKKKDKKKKKSKDYSEDETEDETPKKKDKKKNKLKKSKDYSEDETEEEAPKKKDRKKEKKKKSKDYSEVETEEETPKKKDKKKEKKDKKKNKLKKSKDYSEDETEEEAPKKKDKKKKDKQNKSKGKKGEDESEEESEGEKLKRNKKKEKRKKSKEINDYREEESEGEKPKKKDKKKPKREKARKNKNKMTYYDEEESEYEEELKKKSKKLKKSKHEFNEFEEEKQKKQKKNKKEKEYSEGEYDEDEHEKPKIYKKEKKNAVEYSEDEGEKTKKKSKKEKISKSPYDDLKEKQTKSQKENENDRSKKEKKNEYESIESEYSEYEEEFERSNSKLKKDPKKEKKNKNKKDKLKNKPSVDSDNSDESEGKINAKSESSEEFKESLIKDISKENESKDEAIESDYSEELFEKERKKESPNEKKNADTKEKDEIDLEAPNNKNEIKQIEEGKIEDIDNESIEDIIISEDSDIIEDKKEETQKEEKNSGLMFDFESEDSNDKKEEMPKANVESPPRSNSFGSSSSSPSFQLEEVTKKTSPQIILDITPRHTSFEFSSSSEDEHNRSIESLTFSPSDFKPKPKENFLAHESDEKIISDPEPIVRFVFNDDTSKPRSGSLEDKSKKLVDEKRNMFKKSESRSSPNLLSYETPEEKKKLPRSPSGGMAPGSGMSPAKMKHAPIVLIKKSPNSSPTGSPTNHITQFLSPPPATLPKKEEDKSEKGIKIKIENEQMIDHLAIPSTSNDFEEEEEEMHPSEIPVDMNSDSLSDVDIADLIKPVPENIEQPKRNLWEAISMTPEDEARDRELHPHFDEKDFAAPPKRDSPEVKDEQLRVPPRYMSPVYIPMTQVAPQEAPVVQPKPSSEIRNFIRKFFTPEIYSELQKEKAIGGQPPLVEIPESVPRPGSFMPDYIDIIVDLINEMVMTCDISSLFFEAFLDKVEEVLKISPIDKEAVFTSQLDDETDEYCDIEQINTSFKIADEILYETVCDIFDLK